MQTTCKVEIKAKTKQNKPMNQTNIKPQPLQSLMRQITCKDAIEFVFY